MLTSLVRASMCALADNQPPGRVSGKATLQLGVDCLSKIGLVV